MNSNRLKAGALGKCLRAPMLITVLLDCGTQAHSAIVLYIDVPNQQMSLVGTGPYVDLKGDASFPNYIRLRTAGSTTGLFYEQSPPDDFASVGGLGSVEDNGPRDSFVRVRSNGRVLDLQLPFPTSSSTTSGYLMGGVPLDYSLSNLFTSAIGDGSGLTSRTLTPYMPDPDATFPFGSDFEIAIVTELPSAIPEPATWYAIISGLGLIGLLCLRRKSLKRRRRQRHGMCRNFRPEFRH